MVALRPCDEGGREVAAGSAAASFSDRAAADSLGDGGGSVRAGFGFAVGRDTASSGDVLHETLL